MIRRNRWNDTRKRNENSKSESHIFLRYQNGLDFKKKISVYLSATKKWFSFCLNNFHFEHSCLLCYNKKSRILEEHIIFSSRFISVMNTYKLITKSISNTDWKVKNNSITLLFWENKGRKPIRVKVNYIQSKAVFWKSSIS